MPITTERPEINALIKEINDLMANKPINVVLPALLFAFANGVLTQGDSANSADRAKVIDLSLDLLGAIKNEIDLG